MNFQPELAAKVLTGEKTVTRRGVSVNPRSRWFVAGCKLVVGQDYAVCPGRGKDQVGRIVVTGVTLERLGYLTDYEARREGFEDAFAFECAWRRINGTYDDYSRVWRVAFKMHVPLSPVQAAERFMAAHAEAAAG